MKIFRGCDPDELSLIELGKLFHEVDKSTNVRFWLCAPNYELHARLLRLRVENDINVMNECCKGIGACGVGVDFNRGPYGNAGESNRAHNLDSTRHEGGMGPTENIESNGGEEEPDWLIEGFETIDDEYIFAPKKGVKAHVETAFSQASVTKRFLQTSNQPEQQTETQTAMKPDKRSHEPGKKSQQSTKGRQQPERISQQPAKKNQQAEGGVEHESEHHSQQQTEGGSNNVFEEWNEPVVGDEELLDKCSSDDNNEHLDFDPKLNS
ncbi:hypothetical protein ACH5RR_017847 [Cinchona calisaya]|uniref:Uncharacterized protein n=1 Tax=Cinchona calisaya TaxID=153742 RepID=A0ABD2ZL19_9GENT